jgi:hypothetical protein
MTSATARIPSNTHTHAGVSLPELELEVVVGAGRMICRVVVCSTVSVVTTVVGSGVDSIVVVPAAWTLPTAVARTIPATRQAISPAICSDFLISGKEYACPVGLSSPISTAGRRLTAAAARSYSRRGAARLLILPMVCDREK